MISSKNTKLFCFFLDIPLQFHNPLFVLFEKFLEFEDPFISGLDVMFMGTKFFSNYLEFIFEFDFLFHQQIHDFFTVSCICVHHVDQVLDLLLVAMLSD